MGNPHNTAVTPNAFSKMFHPMTIWERLENTLTYPLMTSNFHAYMERQIKFIHKYIGTHVTNVFDLYKEVALILANSHYSLNGVKPLVPTVVEVGGLHIRDENETLPEVRSVRKLVYFSIFITNQFCRWYKNGWTNRKVASSMYRLDLWLKSKAFPLRL